MPGRLRALKVITPAQVRRIKRTSLVFCIAIGIQLAIQNFFVEAKIKPTEFEGPYRFNGENYDQF